MNVSPPTRQDMVCGGLFLVVGVALGLFMQSSAPGWMRGSTTPVWFEFCAMVFFMRPIFSAEARQTGWGRFLGELARMLVAFVLAMVALMACQQWIFQSPPADLSTRLRSWVLVPAGIGCIAYTVGFLCRVLSKRMGC